MASVPWKVFSKFLGVDEKLSRHLSLIMKLGFSSIAVSVNYAFANPVNDILDIAEEQL